jgi:hypothetical protein
MQSHTFVYALPWLLGAVLQIAAEVRERMSRKNHSQGRTRKLLEIRWLSASIVAGGALVGSFLGGLASSEFHAIWVVNYTLWPLFVFIGLTRLLGRSPGVAASAMLSVFAGLVSFLLVGSLG